MGSPPTIGDKWSVSCCNELSSKVTDTTVTTASHTEPQHIVNVHDYHRILLGTQNHSRQVASEGRRERKQIHLPKDFGIS